MTTGLHLIPNRISQDRNDVPLTSGTKEVLEHLRHFVVENIRNARRYLRDVSPDFPIDESQFIEMNKHAEENGVSRALKWLRSGANVGLLSDAGLPGIADPGSDLIIQAHKADIPVIPHPGPSSILLALIASGLNGQQFNFNAYIPIKGRERIKKLQEMEKQSARNRRAEIFMETPYRNMQVFGTILGHLHPDTLLCVACDIGGAEAFIKTLPIAEWKKLDSPDLHKRPAVFILQVADNMK